LRHLGCIVVIIKSSEMTKRCFATRVISNAIVSALVTIASCHYFIIANNRERVISFCSSKIQRKTLPMVRLTW
jgi:hypothetical protein